MLWCIGVFLCIPHDAATYHLGHPMKERFHSGMQSAVAWILVTLSYNQISTYRRHHIYMQHHPHKILSHISHLRLYTLTTWYLIPSLPWTPCILTPFSHTVHTLYSLYSLKLHSLLNALVWGELWVDAEVLKVVMKEGVEILRKHVTLINMKVLSCGKSLGRVQLGHV